MSKKSKKTTVAKQEPLKLDDYQMTIWTEAFMAALPKNEAPDYYQLELARDAADFLMRCREERWED